MLIKLRKAEAKPLGVAHRITNVRKEWEERQRQGILLKRSLPMEGGKMA